MLAAHPQEELRRNLGASLPLRRAGLQVAVSPPDVVVITCREHALGVWRVSAETFEWTPVAYTEPTFRTRCIDEAVTHSITTLAGPRPTRLSRALEPR